MGSLTQLAPDGWDCDVCGLRRPDEMIGVATHFHTDANGITVNMNVKYCRDNAICERTAQVRSLADLALTRMTQECNALQAALMEFHEKLVWQRLLFSLVAFVVGFWIGTTL